jgi:hypothetical protein
MAFASEFSPKCGARFDRHTLVHETEVPNSGLGRGKQLGHGQRNKFVRITLI